MEEEKKTNIEKILTADALQNITGVDFRKEQDKVDKKNIDPQDQDYVFKNQNIAVIIVKYIVKENPHLVRIGQKNGGGAMYYWDVDKYQLFTSDDLDALVLDFTVRYNIPKAFNNVTMIRRALNVWPTIPVIKEMNPFPDLINLKNGVLNIHTKELFPHDPKYYFDYRLEVDFDAKANDCKHFMKFLNDIFSGDQDTIANMIRLGGYLLDSSTAAKKCWFFDGNGGSGKSTLINTFTMFFPERTENPVVTGLSLDELSTNGFDKEDLISSRFNQCAETNSKKLYDAEFLKLMVTGDLIKVSRKFLKPYTFRYQGKIILIGNGAPKFSDGSDGIARRIMFINFNNRYKPEHEVNKTEFAKEKRIFVADPELENKIKSEATSILNLFIEGLLDLRKNKYQFIESAESSKAMEEFRKGSDTVREFLLENYAIDFSEKTPLNVIFNDFRLWYMDNVQDTRSMKFRSAEMAKRIKEVFGFGDCGREVFRNLQTGMDEKLTCYNLRKKLKQEDLLEEEKDDFDISTAVEDIKGQLRL